jgi:hypothetical protein
VENVMETWKTQSHQPSPMKDTHSPIGDLLLGLPHYIIPDNSTWNSVHDSTTYPSNILSMLPFRRVDIHGNNTPSTGRAHERGLGHFSRVLRMENKHDISGTSQSVALSGCVGLLVP